MLDRDIKKFPDVQIFQYLQSNSCHCSHILMLMDLYKTKLPVSHDAFQTTQWRWISGILGVICLSLVAILGIVLKTHVYKPSSEPTVSPRTTTEFQEDSGNSSCQEKWVGYRCTCYFISHESKTWEESRHFCASRNSALLQMHNKDELNFMKFSGDYFWLGITYSEKHRDWVWENGSKISPDLLSISHIAEQNYCIAYRPSGSTLRDRCTEKNFYICKQQLI
ncbi:natural killer cells antigen CD94-like [Talpa occidentalis]|uniref:natural killer cells antigen CD94-like n=1 Tax=Talpa occidentalis TaxID=50954 RepID=UPI0023F79EA0|nr:natural killer cells antigen CD94-like [Talpa occidentalis]